MTDKELLELATTHTPPLAERSPEQPLKLEGR